MSRRHDRERLWNGAPPGDRSWFVSPGTMLAANVVGVIVLIFFASLTWERAQRVQNTLDERLGGIENRLAQLSTKLDQAPRAGATATRGPDPNRVYPVKTDGAPVRGPKDAPVTIAEFSDFQ